MILERAWTRAALRTVALIAGFSILSLGLAVSPATAASVCDPAVDSCVVVPYTAQTPLGLVTVTISATNVATVHLTPTTPNTLVFGVPFGYPPAPPSIPGYARTSISTTAGLINIDTVIIPAGPLSRFTLPSIAVISIIPPGPPCRASTSGTTVVFTPIARPGAVG
jgi:hypothetical protein